jgi:hypothetical protein
VAISDRVKELRRVRDSDPGPADENRLTPTRTLIAEVSAGHLASIQAGDAAGAGPGAAP